jgi:zinc protease
VSSSRLVVRARRVAGAPVVAVRVWLRGGARTEALPGQALLTGRLLAEGSRRRDWRRIAAEAENRGMGLHGFGGFESHGVALDALAADWEQALAWAAELALEPVFPEERAAFLRRQAEAELESLADQPDVKTAWGFLRQLYHPHPFARPLQGDPESLSHLVPADCAAFHHDALRRGAIVAVAGAIDEEAVARRVAALFADLAGDAAPWPEPPAPDGSTPRRAEVRTGAADQAHLYLGHLTLPRVHPDYPALELLSVVLGSGAGLAGRIPGRIRERDGLAYSAAAAAVAGAGLDPGRLVAYVATAPQTVPQAQAAVVEELTRLLADGLTDEEFEETRSYLLGRDPFRRETARQWAEILADAELYGLPLDRPEWIADGYRALDRAAVETAARRHLDPAKLKVTVGLPGRRRQPRS